MSGFHTLFSRFEVVSCATELLLFLAWFSHWTWSQFFLRFFLKKFSWSVIFGWLWLSLSSFIMISEVFGGWTSKCAARNSLWNGITCHERIFENFIEGRSFRWIQNQNSFDQFSRLFWNSDMIWETVTASLDFFICGFNFRGFKWRFSYQLCVNNNSNWPDINFIRMTFSLKNFRSNIVRSTANSFFLFLIVL